MAFQEGTIASHSTVPAVRAQCQVYQLLDPPSPKDLSECRTARRNSHPYWRQVSSFDLPRRRKPNVQAYLFGWAMRIRISRKEVFDGAYLHSLSRYLPD